MAETAVLVEPRIIVDEYDDFPSWEAEFNEPGDAETMPSAENRGRSFDPLASIKRLRHDLHHLGRVLPETLDQVLDEEMSYFTEGMDRAARTNFVLRRDGAELVYFDKGDWRPYMGMILTGAETARGEAAEDPRRQFLADWAAADVRHGYAMQALQPGEQRVWKSEFPYAMQAAHGDKFLEYCGLFPHRQMGFLYQAYCRDDGYVVLESQTVDRSDPQAFEAAMQAASNQSDAGTNIDMDGLVRAYDGVLTAKHGDRFYAGRLSEELDANVWDTIRRQHDLIDYFLSELQLIAARDLSEDELETAAKKHVYGVWAAFKQRIDGASEPISSQAPRSGETPGLAVVARTAVHDEVMMAFQLFAEQGRVLIGCGGAIEMKSEEDILKADSQDVFDAIFGGKRQGEEKYSFNRRMYCLSCQTAPKKDEKMKMCGPCGACRHCDAMLRIKAKSTPES